MSEPFELDLELGRLIADQKYEDALQVIGQADLQAKESKDPHLHEQVLSQYVWLYSLKSPPDLEKAEFYSREREQLSPTGYNKLQTAFLLYWTVCDPVRARPQTEDALQAARNEGDTRTLYQGLGLLGLILLDLKHLTEAVLVFQEIRQMVAEKQKIVVGDETLFLERMYAAGLEKEAIALVAKILASVCRDPEFVKRLQALS
jgi:hypothetical protein